MSGARCLQTTHRVGSKHEDRSSNRSKFGNRRRNRAAARSARPQSDVRRQAGRAGRGPGQGDRRRRRPLRHHQPRRRRPPRRHRRGFPRRAGQQRWRRAGPRKCRRGAPGPVGAHVRHQRVGHRARHPGPATCPYDGDGHRRVRHLDCRRRRLRRRRGILRREGRGALDGGVHAAGTRGHRRTHHRDRAWPRRHRRVLAHPF